LSGRCLYLDISRRLQLNFRTCWLTGRFYKNSWACVTLRLLYKAMFRFLHFKYFFRFKLLLFFRFKLFLFFNRFLLNLSVLFLLQFEFLKLLFCRTIYCDLNRLLFFANENTITGFDWHVNLSLTNFCCTWHQVSWNTLEWSTIRE